MFTKKPILRTESVNVIFFDLDDTLTNPMRDTDGNYIISTTGFIDATLLDISRLSKIVAIAKEKNIPLHIVTARPDIPENHELIENLLSLVEGFAEEHVGGFKKHHIHFAGTIIHHPDGTAEYAAVPNRTKSIIIQTLHEEYYSHLNKQNCLFVDDFERELSPVRNNGFRCLQATKDLAHLDEIIRLLEIMPVPDSAREMRVQSDLSSRRFSC